MGTLDPNGETISTGDILAVGGAWGCSPTILVSHTALGIPSTADIDAMSLNILAGTPPTLNLVEFSVAAASAGFTLDDGTTMINSGAQVIGFVSGGTNFLAHDATG